MLESNLKLYSLGIVVETKPELQDIIIVSPIEHINLQSNKLLKDNKRTFVNNLTDIDGIPQTTEIKSTDHMRAKWINLGNNNRASAPDVVKGETVLLFKFADVDEYFWTTMFREPSLRRLENIFYSYSNLPKGINAYTKESSYWVNITTKHKKIQLHTSDNDGELCKYDITLDTKAGSLTIEDSNKNIITLLSQNGDLNIDLNNSCNVKTKNTITLTATNSVNIKAPSILLDGNVSITGSLSTKGNSSTSGNISTNGDISSSGNITGSGTVTGNPISGCPCC